MSMPRTSGRRPCSCGRADLRRPARCVRRRRSGEQSRIRPSNPPLERPSRESPRGVRSDIGRRALVSSSCGRRVPADNSETSEIVTRRRGSRWQRRVRSAACNLREAAGLSRCRWPRRAPRQQQERCVSSHPEAGITLTAFFDSRAEAEAAMGRLRAAGIPDAHLRLMEGAETAAAGERETGGILGRLSDLLFPETDQEAYAEALSRGGYLVSVVDVSEAQRVAALDILDSDSAVDVDERRAAWRSEGQGGSVARIRNRFPAPGPGRFRRRPARLHSRAGGVHPRPAGRRRRPRRGHRTARPVLRGPEPASRRAGVARDAAGAPRRVQPGFEDVAPGQVPKPAEFSDDLPRAEYREEAPATRPEEEPHRVLRREPGLGRARVRSYVR